MSAWPHVTELFVRWIVDWGSNWFILEKSNIIIADTQIMSNRSELNIYCDQAASIGQFWLILVIDKGICYSALQNWICDCECVT